MESGKICNQCPEHNAICQEPLTAFIINDARFLSSAFGIKLFSGGMGSWEQSLGMLVCYLVTACGMGLVHANFGLHASSYFSKCIDGNMLALGIGDGKGLSTNLVFSFLLLSFEHLVAGD